MTDAPPLVTELIAQETRVWNALMAGDPTADEALLSADFLGVYPDGFSDRAGHSSQLAQGPSISSYRMEDCRALALGPEHGALSYRAVFRRVGRDRDETMYVTSIWERTETGWINLLSQDTPALP